MIIPNGYPIRTVDEKKYYDDLDSCLDVYDLEADEQYVLRAIKRGGRPDSYAVDYPVSIDRVDVKEPGGMHSAANFSVVFRPVSAEGVILPQSTRERIMEFGLLYSTMRLIFTTSFKSGHNGYFVGSDDIDEEWLNFHPPQPSDTPIEPELITK